MSNGIEEIEQGFIPTPEMIAQVRSGFKHHYEIIQAYLPNDKQSVYLRRKISFEPAGEGAQQAVITFSVNGSAVLSVSETDPQKIAALRAEVEKDGGKFLQSARIRYQHNHESGKTAYSLTFKGPKVDGQGTEYEYSIDNHAGALRLMIDYGYDNLVHKTRHVREGVEIAGKPRTLELDEFHGGLRNGDLKLEIEHASSADKISQADWQPFAEREVTGEELWSNKNIAGYNPHALALLKQEAGKLNRPRESGEHAVSGR